VDRRVGVQGAAKTGGYVFCGMCFEILWRRGGMLKGVIEPSPLSHCGLI
jgi:hypothetical protein